MKMIKLWIGNLGKYNEGQLVGEWFDLPVDMEEVKEKIGLTGDYEEWFIADYEAPFEVGEYDNIDNLNNIAELLEGKEDWEINAMAYLVDNFYAEDWEEAWEKVDDGDVIIYHDVYDMEDIAREYVESCGLPSNTEFYIDEDAIKRDLRLDGTFQEMEYERTQEMIEEGELEEGEEYEMTEEEEDSWVEEIVNTYVAEQGSSFGNHENVKRFFETYFDYEAFGRDMEIEGDFTEIDKGTWMEILV
jgi:antirestriction protein